MTEVIKLLFELAIGVCLLAVIVIITTIMVENVISAYRRINRNHD